MRLAFMGSPDFAVPALRALHDAGHEIAAVYCQQPRPAGRGHTVRQCPVHRAALELGMPVLTPARLRGNADAQAAFAQLDLDAAVVAAYGLILPQAMLQAPRRGCLNIHASLLPRWRGAAPIQRALIAGDATTGITIMQMDEGLDTGAILLQEPIRVDPADTARTLGERLATLGARLIVEALATPGQPRPQAATGITYAAKIDKGEARIDWSESAAAIERKVRAFDPEPGAFTACAGVMLKVWRASIERDVRGAPGEICESGPRGVVVACGADGLRLIEMQRAGGKRLPAPAFLAGHNMARGTRLG